MNLEDDGLVPSPPASYAIEPACSFTLINNYAGSERAFLNRSHVVNAQNSTRYTVHGNSKNYSNLAVIRLFNIPNQIILENLSGLVKYFLVRF